MREANVGVIGLDQRNWQHSISSSEARYICIVVEIMDYEEKELYLNILYQNNQDCSDKSPDRDDHVESNWVIFSSQL